MYFPNPWITIFSFVYIFLAGIFGFKFSKKIVEIYLSKINSNKFLKSLEPVVGSIGFIFGFGINLIILYFFIIYMS
jgi:hypothetical protein